MDSLGCRTATPSPTSEFPGRYAKATMEGFSGTMDTNAGIRGQSRVSLTLIVPCKSPVPQLTVPDVRSLGAMKVHKSGFAMM